MRQRELIEKENYHEDSKYGVWKNKSPNQSVEVASKDWDRDQKMGPWSKIVVAITEQMKSWSEIEVAINQVPIKQWDRDENIAVAINK